MYPKTGFTKRDLIDYYVRIAPVLLPHLHDRPLTLKRYPDGVEGQHFYEKQCPSHRPGLGADGGGLEPAQQAQHRLLPRRTTCRRWCGSANLADIELHTSLALAAATSTRPTMMVFDLDPGRRPTSSPAAGSGCGCATCSSSSGSSRFAKTSGSKGLQVYVPLNVRRDLRRHEAVRARGRGAAREAAPEAGRVAHDQVAARREGADRLEPERRAQDHGQRVLAAREGAPDGLHAGHLGRGRGARRSGAAAPRRSPSSTPTCSSASSATATCSRRCSRCSRSCRSSERSNRETARTARRGRPHAARDLSERPPRRVGRRRRAGPAPGRRQPGHASTGRRSRQSRSQIEEDVDSLRDIMAALGVEEDRIKQAVAWAAEKVGRLKLNGQLLGYSPLSRLVELEGMMLGRHRQAGAVGGAERELRRGPAARRHRPRRS